MRKLIKTYGKIIDARKNDLFINCGEGTVLKIEELQIEGKNRMKTVDFLNGVKLAAGDGFGD